MQTEASYRFVSMIHPIDIDLRRRNLGFGSSSISFILIRKKLYLQK